MARAAAVTAGRTSVPPRRSDGTVSVVVATHNDGPNIGPLLERLLVSACVTEVVVVASGCDDQTVPVACEIADAAPDRLDVYVEPERSGKTAAVNFGIQRCSADRIVIVSGDVLPSAGAIEQLVAALDEPGVGMTGGRPVPVDQGLSPVGAAVQLLWRMHHRLALRQPKLGEMVALRAEAAVPLPRTSVDEACFQARLEANGWQCRYVPAAVVLNRGPGTWRDFVRQRRQVHTGHLWLRRRERYTVPGLRPTVLLGEYAAEVRAALGSHSWRYAAGTTAGVAMELWARALARLDYARGREKHVWDMVTSAKDPALGPNGVGPRGG